METKLGPGNLDKNSACVLVSSVKILVSNPILKDKHWYRKQRILSMSVELFHSVRVPKI